MFIFSEDKTVAINSNDIHALVISPKKDNKNVFALIAVFNDISPETDTKLTRMIVKTGSKQDCINLIAKINSKGGA